LRGKNCAIHFTIPEHIQKSHLHGREEKNTEPETKHGQHLLKKKTARFVGFEMGQSEWFPLQTPNKSKSLEPTTEDDSYYTIYHATEMVES